MLALGLVLAALPAYAKKTHLFLESFGPAAQPTFPFPKSVAVDTARDSILVVDAEADSISRFHADGTPDNFAALGGNVIDGTGGSSCPGVPTDCDKTPENGLEFTRGVGEEGIAIDASGTATDGNIYVSQGEASAGNLVDIFDSDGSYLGQITAAGSQVFGTSGSFPFSPCGAAVDGAGALYVAGGYDEQIYKFDPSGAVPVNADAVASFDIGEPVCGVAAGVGPTSGSLFVNTFFTFAAESLLKLDASSGAVESALDFDEYRLLAVDPVSGHVLATSANGQMKEFNASGSNAFVTSTTSLTGATGLAINGSKIYVSAPSAAGPTALRAYGPVVTLPDVFTEDAAITGNTSATVTGKVDPDGVPLEECEFDLGSTTTYGGSVPCSESVGEIGNTVKTVHADLSGLAPETLYHFRLRARNSAGAVSGADRTFKTPSKPSIASIGVLEVNITSATLRAQINPENAATAFRFEWGLDTSYNTGAVEGSVGGDAVEHLVSREIGGLEGGRTYHFRVTASNDLGVVMSGDRTFNTFPPSLVSPSCPGNAVFRAGPSQHLPDCRAYEMVSPVDKSGGEVTSLVQGLSFPARLDQSATDGDKFTYSTSPAFADAKSAPFASQYIARRTPTEWSSQAINAPRESVNLDNNPVLNLDAPYKMFSPDLSSGWMYQSANPPLDECAPEGFINLYRHDNLTGGFEALISSAPPKLPAGGYRLELQGVSDDGARSVFRANAKLAPNAAASSIYQLYEHVREPDGCGQLRLVSVMPNGSVSTALNGSAGTPLGPGEYRESTVARAVSRDGTRVVFTLGAGETTTGQLNIRVNADQEQSAVSGGKCTEAEKACTLRISSSDSRFWSASSDGAKVIYSVGDEFVEFDLQKALAGEPASTLIAAEASGIVAVDEDASHIYLVSSEQLGGLGVSGQPNLYLYEPEEAASSRFALVATVSPRDLDVFRLSGFSLASAAPIPNGVRLTADGDHLAFVSTASLTGYDNAGAADGLPALEVYLYDAGDGNLACISCNPANSQPQGRKFLGNGVTRRVASQMAPGENQLFAPRALTGDGGKLFFESFESLLPRDVNKAADVYEWERAASPSACDEAGAELYVPSAGGCLSLISSGQDEADSEFADASPDGSDVFIRTSSSLVPQDPGQVDIYDVREGGGQPAPKLPGSSCETGGNPAFCQSPPAVPAVQSPASVSGQSTGNAVPKKCPKGKMLNKKGNCVKKPRKHKKHKKKGAKRAAHKTGRAGK